MRDHPRAWWKWDKQTQQMLEREMELYYAATSILPW